MNTNDDYLSLNDFLSFLKKNIIFIIIVTSIFTYAGYYFNEQIKKEIKDQEKYVVDLNFIFLENEIGYLMKHIDEIFDTSSTLGKLLSTLVRSQRSARVLLK